MQSHSWQIKKARETNPTNSAPPDRHFSLLADTHPIFVFPIRVLGFMLLPLGCTGMHWDALGCGCACSSTCSFSPHHSMFPPCVYPSMCIAPRLRLYVPPVCIFFWIIVPSRMGFLCVYFPFVCMSLRTYVTSICIYRHAYVPLVCTSFRVCPSVCMSLSYLGPSVCISPLCVCSFV